MKPYTVLLLYPDYMTADYGQETFLAHVAAPTVKDAQYAAQMDAISMNTMDSDKAEDFSVLAVFEGHLNDIKE